MGDVEIKKIYFKNTKTFIQQTNIYIHIQKYMNMQQIIITINTYFLLIQKTNSAAQTICYINFFYITFTFTYNYNITIFFFVSTLVCLKKSLV